MRSARLLEAVRLQELVSWAPHHGEPEPQAQTPEPGARAARFAPAAFPARRHTQRLRHSRQAQQS